MNTLKYIGFAYHRALRVISLAVIVSATIVLVVFWLPFAGTVHGKLFPVVSDVVIAKVQRAPDGKTLIWGWMSKDWPCEFKRITWYRGWYGRWHQKKHVTFLEDRGGAPSSHPPGDAIAFGPWKIEIPFMWFWTAQFVQVEHDCGLPWTTITLFYEKGQYNELHDQKPPRLAQRNAR